MHDLQDNGSTAKFIATGNNETIQDTPDGESSVANTELDAVKQSTYTFFIELGDTKMVKATVSRKQIRGAFNDANSFGDFVTQIFAE